MITALTPVDPKLKLQLEGSSHVTFLSSLDPKVQSCFFPNILPCHVIIQFKDTL